MEKLMSSGNPNFSKSGHFGARFTEACGTSEPARKQRLLNISYQAAKNYLGGRLPDSRVLMTIAERTPYSLHWLLTGKGEKFSLPAPSEDTLPLARQISELIRREVEGAVTIALAKETANSGSRTIVLRPHEVLTEAVRDGENQQISGRQRTIKD
jgi:hypothetical protein